MILRIFNRWILFWWILYIVGENVYLWCPRSFFLYVHILQGGEDA